MSIGLLYKIMSELDADANTVLAIPVKTNSDSEISIDKELDRLPKEKKQYLIGVLFFQIC